MAGKGKKKKNSVASNASGGDAAKKAKKPGGKSKRGGKSKNKFNIDILADAAMDNAYYACHNVQELLNVRGFAWPESQKKKKKGKRR